MTCSLIVFRHAKSEWSEDYAGADAERPLAKRGRKAAKLAGRFLADIDSVPEAVICSPAKRARATLELAREARDWESSVREAQPLYDGGVEGLLAETELGRGVLGVVDGSSPKRAETDEDIAERKAFLRAIGYKL